jgi:AcrR family transcriptional regulator
MRDNGIMTAATPTRRPRATDNARLGTALTRRAAIDAATQAYLRGEAVDMSALAAHLGIGRSTLYRLAGNRDELLGIVLAEATERTFRRAAADAAATSDGGIDRVLDVINRFMHAVIDAEPLQTLCQHEPLLFIRLALLPGPVEQTAAKLIAEMLHTEITAGRLETSLPATTLSQAIVRMCDAHLYAPLLGGTEPETDTALDLVAALLSHLNKPPRAGNIESLDDKVDVALGGSE